MLYTYYDRLLTQPVYYDVNAPPLLPYPIPYNNPILHNQLTYLATIALNKITENTSKIAYVYVHNLLNYPSTNNEWFRYYLTLYVYLVEQDLNTKQNALEFSNLDRLAKKAANIFVAKIVAETPELHQVLDSEFVQKSMNNYHKALSLINHITEIIMANNPYNPNQQPPVQQGYNQPVYPQQQQIPYPHQPYPNQIPYPQQQPVYPQQQPPMQPVYGQPQVPVGQPYQPNQQRPIQQPIQQPNMVSDGGKAPSPYDDIPVNSTNNTPVNQPQQQVEQNTVEDNSNTDKNKVLKPLPGSEYKPLEIGAYIRVKEVEGDYYKWKLKENEEVDRQQHTITILGFKKLDRYNRVDKTTKVAEHLTQIKGEDIQKALNYDEKQPDPKIEHEVLPYILEDYQVGDSLDELIQRLRCKSLDKQSKVFRLYGSVVDVYPTEGQHNLEKIVKTNVTNLNQLADQIKYLVNDLPADQSRYKSLVYYHNVNRVLTDMVNKFLRNELSLILRIDSFIEDYSELGKYLENKYNDQYREALSLWDRDNIDRILPGYDVEEDTDVKDDYTLSTITIPVSITYVDLFNDELKIEDWDIGSRLIKRHTSPLLYDITESVFMDLPIDKPLQPLHHYLVTNDNVVYTLHKTYISRMGYLIGKD